MSQVRHTTFVSVSLTPDAREALRRMAARLSGKASRTLSVSDALVLVEQLVEHAPVADVIEVLDDVKPAAPRRAPVAQSIVDAVTTPPAADVNAATTPVGNVQAWRLGAQQAYNGLTVAQRRRVDAFLRLPDRFHRSRALRDYGDELRRRYNTARVLAQVESILTLADEQHANDPHLNPDHPNRANRNDASK